MYIAISAAGAFRTDDGGTSWKPINRGLRSQYIPDQDAEVGHCVHHIAMSPKRPGTLFMQKHWDVMRSDDAGDSWNEVSGNLPTDFGFVIDVHAHEPETIYVVPIKSDSEHYVARRQAARVSQPKSGGNEWEALTKGLPQETATSTCCATPWRWTRWTNAEFISARPAARYTSPPMPEITGTRLCAICRRCLVWKCRRLGESFCSELNNN